MSALETTSSIEKSNTRKFLYRESTKLRIEAGLRIIAHLSLISLSWVYGGPIAIIQALIGAVTPHGKRNKSYKKNGYL